MGRAMRREKQPPTPLSPFMPQRVLIRGGLKIPSLDKGRAGEGFRFGAVWKRPLLAALLLFGIVATASATPLGDELLAPAAPRPAPRSRPEIVPRPAIFTARSLVYAARSADGRWIATVEKGDNVDELWLHKTG